MTVSALGIANSSARLLPKGTVALSRTATIGKVAILGREMATSQDFACYICGPRLLNSYLAHLFRGMGGEWERLMAGSTHNTIYMPTFQNLQILVPSMPEQEAIAEALSNADGLIEGLERLIAKKRLIKRGAMQDLLTAKRRLPGFSGEWKEKHLGEIAAVIMGQSPRSAAYNSEARGLPLIQGAADIRARKTIRRIFTSEITKLGKRGDIILTVRAPVGEVSRAEFDLCLGRGVCAVRTGQEFVYHALINAESAWSSLSKGSTFDSVNADEVRAFEVMYPLDSEERVSIANVLTDMDAEILALEARLEKARQVKESMMQNLLTGRIRPI
ncbi:hypothetical protein U879_18640 [Defluviimonas sp. 20V17]|nr:hypothetical protein U879_18640 [Defluviimonas sp. 20V17]